MLLLVLSSTPILALSFSVQQNCPNMIPISSQLFLAGSPRNSALSVRLRIVQASNCALHSTLMVGFGASKDAAAKGSKISKGRSSSGGSGASHSSSSFPPAMLKQFKLLKEEGGLVVKVYARIRGDSLASPGPWHEVDFGTLFVLVGCVCTGLHQIDELI